TQPVERRRVGVLAVTAALPGPIHVRCVREAVGDVPRAPRIIVQDAVDVLIAGPGDRNDAESIMSHDTSPLGSDRRPAQNGRGHRTRGSVTGCFNLLQRAFGADRGGFAGESHVTTRPPARRRAASLSDRRRAATLMDVMISSTYAVVTRA